MYFNILKKLQDCIRHNKYVVTLHAEEEIDEDGLSIFDVERAILTGDITERQKDSEKKGWKYLVRGQALDGSEVIVVVKLGPTGKMVMITVFRDE